MQKILLQPKYYTWPPVPHRGGLLSLLGLGRREKTRVSVPSKRGCASGCGCVSGCGRRCDSACVICPPDANNGSTYPSNSSSSPTGENEEHRSYVTGDVIWRWVVRRGLTPELLGRDDEGTSCDEM